MVTESPENVELKQKIGNMKLLFLLTETAIFYDSARES